MKEEHSMRQINVVNNMESFEEFRGKLKKKLENFLHCAITDSVRNKINSTISN